VAYYSNTPAAAATLSSLWLQQEAWHLLNSALGNIGKKNWKRNFESFAKQLFLGPNIFFGGAKIPR